MRGVEAGHLPLRDFIDGIDVIDALGAARRIALMHRVQAQKAGLALRLRLAPLADLHRRGPRLGVVQAPLAITLAMAQVVQMSHRDRGQPRVFAPSVDVKLAFQNASGGRAAQGFMRLVDRDQQLDVGPRVSLRKTPPLVGRRLNPPADRVTGD